LALSGAYLLSLRAMNAGRCRMGRSLNPLPMIGRLTAEPSDLSREAGLFCQIRRLLRFCRPVGIPHRRKVLVKARMDIGNENDQVS